MFLYVVICFYIHRWSCVPLSPAQLGPLGHFHRHRWRQPGENHRKNWGKPQIGGTKTLESEHIMDVWGPKYVPRMIFWGTPSFGKLNFREKKWVCLKMDHVP